MIRLGQDSFSRMACAAQKFCVLGLDQASRATRAHIQTIQSMMRTRMECVEAILQFAGFNRSGNPPVSRAPDTLSAGISLTTSPRYYSTKCCSSSFASFETHLKTIATVSAW